MSQKNKTILYDIFNISEPWEISFNSYSEQQLLLELQIDYKSNVISCPLCSKDANVIDKRIVAWESIDFFEYKTKMTACIPIIDCHNPNCRVDHDQTVLSNTLLLDIIVRQLNNTESMNPFQFFFNTVDVTYDKPLSSDTLAMHQCAVGCRPA